MLFLSCGQSAESTSGLHAACTASIVFGEVKLVTGVHPWLLVVLVDDCPSQFKCKSSNPVYMCLGHCWKLVGVLYLLNNNKVGDLGW